MKLIVGLGMLVIFISCFFMFFTFDSMIRTKMECSYEGGSVSCNVTEMNMTIIFGILIVGIFLFIDTIVVYLMVKTWVPGLMVYED